jgi:hypothetical protein
MAQSTQNCPWIRLQGFHDDLKQILASFFSLFHLETPSALERTETGWWFCLGGEPEARHLNFRFLAV